jgi:nucleotide-binding universal stress UspA family protein
MFNKIAVALSFSPYCESLLNEVEQLRSLYNAKLIIIRVSDPENYDLDKERIIILLNKLNISQENVKIVFDKGEPAKKILKACKNEQVDLLMLGALPKESFIKQYLGSIARKVLRQSECSVLLLLASNVQSRFDRITVDCYEEHKIKKAIVAAYDLGYRKKSSQIHLVKQLKLYGLAMSMEEYSEEEYANVKKKHLDKAIREVETLLKDINTYELKTNIKLTSGKPDYELIKFIKNSKTNLLITSAPDHKLGIFDRVFPHHLESVFSDLPCNLLVVH